MDVIVFPPSSALLKRRQPRVGKRPMRSELILSMQVCFWTMRSRKDFGTPYIFAPGTWKLSATYDGLCIHFSHNEAVQGTPASGTADEMTGVLTFPLKRSIRAPRGFASASVGSRRRRHRWEQRGSRPGSWVDSVSVNAVLQVN